MLLFGLVSLNSKTLSFSSVKFKVKNNFGSPRESVRCIAEISTLSWGVGGVRSERISTSSIDWIPVVWVNNDEIKFGRLPGSSGSISRLVPSASAL